METEYNHTGYWEKEIGGFSFFKWKMNEISFGIYLQTWPFYVSLTIWKRTIGVEWTGRG